ncbi:unnamed protein product [Clavelina lepadiformis]|uniref:Carbohydrate sulfotransferase n=1 Tax=Clavelina lepadiformis TaxID=159417 RepID=A0ABP0FFT9_CLALP
MYCDVLSYSKSENGFPHLKAAALELLSMTATSAPSETVFSHAEELRFEQLKANLTSVWEIRCNSSSLNDVLKTAFREPYPALIMQGIDTTLGFLSSLQIPHCDVVGKSAIQVPSPVSPPDCYQFYHSTSACGQRKSWVCDFVQWKYQIITDWLPRFLAYSENNGIYASDLPGCPADFPDMCTNYDQRRCAERLGCRACFCADNLYKETICARLLTRLRRQRIGRSDSAVTGDFCSLSSSSKQNGGFLQKKKLCFLVTCLMVVAMTSVCNLRSRNNKEKRREVEKEQEIKETIKIHCTPSYEDTFGSRSLEIQERCKNRSQTVGSILSNTFKYNDDLKVVMCEVPKVASTTWQILLLRLGGFQAKITKEFLQKWAYSRIPNKQFKQLQNQTEALFRMTNYTTFFLTRHPFERLVSAYFDKLSNRSSYHFYKNVVGKQIAKSQANEHLHGLHSRSCHYLPS